MRRIKIGQIGVKHAHADGKMGCVRKFPEIFDIVGIADTDVGALDKKLNTDLYKGLKRMSINEMLTMPELDAVMVETEEWELVPTGIKCVQAGKHIHLDKPAGERRAEFVQLMNEAKKRELTVQMAYMYRYNPAVKYCIDAVEQGKLGEIFEMDTDMSVQHSPELRKYMANFKGGMMHYLGCHLVDLVYRIQGAPEKVIPYLTKEVYDGVEAVNDAFAVFKYKNGTSTVRTNALEINGYGRRMLAVCGTKGTIEIQPLERPIKMTVSYKDMTEGKNYEYCAEEVHIETVPGDCRYDDMMLDFAAMVRGEKKNPYTYEYELELQRLCHMACGIKVNTD